MPLDPRAKRLLDMVALGQGGGPPRTAAERRAGFAALMALSRPAAWAGRIEPLVVAGAAGPLPARLYRPAAGPVEPGAGLVFFHGGGLVAGDLDTHDGFCRRLAAASGAAVVAIGYRRAPEHTFPAAVEDALASIRAVVAQAGALGLDPARLGVGGDSAGATLATLAARTAGPTLRVQVLLYPVLDPAGRHPSRLAFASGFLLDQAVMDRDLADYLPGGLDPADPRVSPLRAGGFAGLPPALIHTAEYDPVRDEGEAYAAALTAAGVSVRHRRHDGMIHHFLALDSVIPYAREALAAIGADLGAALA